MHDPGPESNLMELFWRPEILFLNFLIGILFLWRIWRFTVVPLLHPDLPQVYPYWVPFFGHLFSFMRDADGTVTKARFYFGNTREPFALVIAGKYIYFITSAKDMSSVFKNNTQLTFDEYVQNISFRVGMSPTSIQNLWKEPSKSDSIRPDAFPNPSGKSIAHLGEVIFKTQLHPGPHAEQLWSSVLERIYSKLSWERLVQSPSAEPRSGEKILSLRRLLFSTLVESTTTSFFGKELLEIEPNLLAHFEVFDETSWKLSYRVPKPWAKDMLAAMEKVSTAFQTYAKLSIARRPGSCWMIPTLEGELRGVGLDSHDIGLQLLMIYWVSNGNPWKVAFWLVTRILFSHDLRKQIEQEIAPLINAEPKLSPNELALKLETCTVLMATFHEVLRTTAGSKTARRVQDTCIIGNKHLEKGGQILIPHRQILLDKSTFGPDAERFNANRLIQDPSLFKNQAFRPFGGGVTYCPGRFLARKEILTIVGLLLGKVKVEIADTTKRLPVMEQELPSLGIMGPKLGEDLFIRVAI